MIEAPVGGSAARTSAQHTARWSAVLLASFGLASLLSAALDVSRARPVSVSVAALLGAAVGFVGAYWRYRASRGRHPGARLTPGTPRAD